MPFIVNVIKCYDFVTLSHTHWATKLYQVSQKKHGAFGGTVFSNLITVN